ncbi:internalin A [Flavobacterium nitrogenifigens]|uniref:Internalin A n=2 Tax=Flavobacterium TaxID=237 RepID=A0A7W7IWL6_9FLAO|nr:MULTISPECIES: leucine-rich repeat domain-containing protein [Flavobacterium]MBB4801926.1 internalin A [Flavobacterium nitrogenifigens]MBB6386884.1 internalin A [Flavobacterium notoginsengisoli]
MKKPLEIQILEKKHRIFLSSEFYVVNNENSVVELKLAKNGIDDISFLDVFNSLIILDLSNNSISDISILEKFKSLEILDLSYNHVSDPTVLISLISLKELNLSNNQISSLSFLKSLKNINEVNLSNNQIFSFSDIDNLPVLNNINLNDNKISGVIFISNLPKLKILKLVRNEISDFFILHPLRNLVHLDLYGNQISDISFIYDFAELSFLDLSRNKISNISHLASLNKLKELYLSNNQISEIDIIENLKTLESLNLSFNAISDISIIAKLEKLQDLNVSGNYEITDISNLRELENLIQLDVSYNQQIGDFSIISFLKKIKVLLLNGVKISDFSFLSNMKEIRTLFLGSNDISNIYFLEKLTSLKTLYLSSNNISDIQILKDLKTIESLYLKNNKISHISILKELKFLRNLDLSENKIFEVEEFNFIVQFSSLHIKAYNNNCFNINKIHLDEKGNNYDTILNALKKLDESKKTYRLPAKVLFLGNTESGKSTLLDYILQEKEPRILKKNLGSTHVVQIETLPVKFRKNAIPKAVFYDFGGQDYYHGLYKAFLSNDSINILLWNKNYDNNQIRKDRNNQLTRDYDRNYWLNQLKFQYDKGNRKKDLEFDRNKREPILLVQTHADKEAHVRDTYKGDCEIFNIKNEFFISLSQESIEGSVIQKIGLKYLEETLHDLIQQKQIIKKEPLWYKEFLNYILRTNTENYILLSKVVSEYKRESDPDNLLLPEVLRELSQTGLVLYYKDDEDLKDVVWLDPSKTVQYIHTNILSKENIIAKRGIVERNIFDGFADEKIVKLLINQKVIFLDEYDNNYIIPGYLPLTEEEDKLYELLTFDFIEPTFILKFEYFIPFGLINQLICFYGKNKNKKHYWRDQLLFTKDNCKILIKLDFTNLEIAVSIKSKDSMSFDKLQKEIFKDILNLYWDKIPVEIKQNNIGKENINIEDINIENLISGTLQASISHKDIKTENIVKAESKDGVRSNYNELVSPDDLYISVDNKYFTSHKELQNEDRTFSKIISFGLEIKKEIQNDKEIEIRRLNKNLVIEESAILYRNFTNNKNTEKMKKIFISYSKFDDDYKKEFVKHLITLKDDNLIDPFNCDEIDLGEDSHEVIQRKLAECDYMVALVSVDLLNTKYIRDFEVDKAEELGKKIIPIIIKPCDWETSKLGKHHASLRGTNISLDKQLYLDDKIKEVSKIERAAFWTAVIKEFREKLFN